MKKVWKFDLSLSREQTVMMPDGAEIIAAQMRRGGISLWAICNPEEELRPRVIAVHGTGEEFDSYGWLYVATVDLQNGSLTRHVFERI